MERLPIEVREAAALESLEKRQNARNAVGINKFAQSKYLEDKDVKAFNIELRKKGLNKARSPIKLGNIDETDNEINAYFDLCDRYSQLPSKKSLCLYLGISVTTFDSYLRELDSEYGELFRAALDYIHSIIEGGAMNNKVNPAVYMFTASNFYGMRDSKQIELSAIAPSQNNAMSSRESLNALRQQIEEEKKMEDAHIIDADFIDKVKDNE